MLVAVISKVGWFGEVGMTGGAGGIKLVPQAKVKLKISESVELLALSIALIYQVCAPQDKLLVGIVETPLMLSVSKVLSI